MTMNDAVVAVVPVLAGGVLGTVYFGGLWWTVQRVASTQRPVLLFLGSLLVRIGITLTGFYVVAAGNWKRMLICLLGFVIARLVVTRLTRVTNNQQTSATPERHHAP